MYAHDSILRGEEGDTPVSVAEALLAADPGTYHAAITPSRLTSDELEILDEATLNNPTHYPIHEQNIRRSHKLAALVAFMVQSEKEPLTASIRTKDSQIQPHIDMTTLFRGLGWSLRTDTMPVSRTFYALNHTSGNPTPSLAELYDITNSAKLSERYEPLMPVEQRRGDIVLFKKWSATNDTCRKRSWQGNCWPRRSN